MRKAEPELVCIAQFTAIDGKQDEFIEALHSLIEPTHKEPGCVRYELNQQIDNPRIVTFVEKWANRQVFDEHCAMPYIVHFFNEVRPQLVESFSVTLHREILP